MRRMDGSFVYRTYETPTFEGLEQLHAPVHLANAPEIFGSPSDKGAKQYAQQLGPYRIRFCREFGRTPNGLVLSPAARSASRRSSGRLVVITSDIAAISYAAARRSSREHQVLRCDVRAGILVCAQAWLFCVCRACHQPVRDAAEIEHNDTMRRVTETSSIASRV